MVALSQSMISWGPNGTVDALSLLEPAVQRIRRRKLLWHLATDLPGPNLQDQGDRKPANTCVFVRVVRSGEQESSKLAPLARS
jgi:hypothetical protein